MKKTVFVWLLIMVIFLLAGCTDGGFKPSLDFNNQSDFEDYVYKRSDVYESAIVDFPQGFEVDQKAYIRLDEIFPNLNPTYIVVIDKNIYLYSSTFFFR